MVGAVIIDNFKRLKPPAAGDAALCGGGSAVISCSHLRQNMQRRQPRIERGEALWLCPRCAHYKPATQYYENPRKWNGISGCCRPCMLEIARAQSAQRKTKQPGEAA